MTILLTVSCTQYNEKMTEKREAQRKADSIAQARKMFVEDSIRHVNDSIAAEIEKAKLERIKKQEEERKDAVKKSVKITSAYLSSPNSAGGCDANVWYKNMSDKTIKYLVWTGYPINAVGDRVGCEIRGFQDYRGKDTGPIKPGHGGGGCWDCAWYNYSARKLILTGIEITYTDGSYFTIKEDEIPLVWAKAK